MPNQVKTNGIEDGAVTSAKLSGGAVNNAAMGTAAVTEAKISDGVVTTVKIADANVTTNKLADSSVSFAKLTSTIFATLSEIIAGTVSKIVTAAAIAPLYYSTRVTMSANQATATSGFTLLLWNTETWDDGGWHNNSTNTSRITVDFTGRVRVLANIEWTNAYTSQYIYYIKKNGTFISYANYIFQTTVSNMSHQVHGAFDCVPGDYFEIEVWQNSGASNPIQSLRSYFLVERMR